MNRSESKYFHTARRMDEALITLLEKKDLEYITVKEICETAGVNRSTFYLHYETISDLVDEAAGMINEKFLSYFPRGSENFASRMESGEEQQLILITREYLLPYLRFVRDNRKIYRAAFRNPESMQSRARYKELKNQILLPILTRFRVPAPCQPYYIAYYIEGIAAIIREWLARDCADEVEMILDIIIRCVGADKAAGSSSGPEQPLSP